MYLAFKKESIFLFFLCFYILSGNTSFSRGDSRKSTELFLSCQLIPKNTASLRHWLSIWVQKKSRKLIILEGVLQQRFRGNPLLLKPLYPKWKGFFLKKQKRKKRGHLDIVFLKSFMKKNRKRKVRFFEEIHLKKRKTLFPSHTTVYDVFFKKGMQWGRALKRKKMFFKKQLFPHQFFICIKPSV